MNEWINKLYTPLSRKNDPKAPNYLYFLILITKHALLVIIANINIYTFILLPTELNQQDAGSSIYNYFKQVFISTYKKQKNMLLNSRKSWAIVVYLIIICIRRVQNKCIELLTGIQSSAVVKIALCLLMVFCTYH